MAEQHSSRWGSPQVRDDMIRRYVVEHQSLRQVAAAVGCSYGTAHLVLTTAGVTLRPRGGVSRSGTEPSARRRTTPASAADATPPPRHAWSGS